MLTQIKLYYFTINKMAKQKLKISEAEIQRNCIEYLQYMRIPFIRNNSFAGMITRPNGSKGFIRNASYPGSPDLLVFLGEGVTLHIEFKSAIGKMSYDQLEYQQTMEKLKHRYYIIRDLTEFTKLIPRRK